MTGTTLFRIDVSGAQNEFTIHSYKMISPFTHTTKLLHCKKAIFYYLSGCLQRVMFVRSCCSFIVSDDDHNFFDDDDDVIFG